jgi:hypothetical protein
MKRLLIDPSIPAFKLSKPGVDLDSAGPDDLLFDIAQGTVSGVLYKGIGYTANYTSFTSDGYGNYTWTLTISFSKTFTIAPSYSYFVPSGDGLRSQYCQNFTNGSSSRDYSLVVWTTQTNINFRVYGNYHQNLTVYYVIYQV